MEGITWWGSRPGSLEDFRPPVGSRPKRAEGRSPQEAEAKCAIDVGLQFLMFSFRVNEYRSRA